MRWQLLHVGSTVHVQLLYVIFMRCLVAYSKCSFHIWLRIFLFLMFSFSYHSYFLFLVFFYFIYYSNFSFLVFFSISYIIRIFVSCVFFNFIYYSYFFLLFHVILLFPVCYISLLLVHYFKRVHGTASHAHPGMVVQTDWWSEMKKKKYFFLLFFCSPLLSLRHDDKNETREKKEHEEKVWLHGMVMQTDWGNEADSKKMIFSTVFLIFCCFFVQLGLFAVTIRKRRRESWKGKKERKERKEEK